MDVNDKEWNLNQLVFVDDTALVADSEERLKQLVEEFGRVCKRRKLRVWHSNEVYQDGTP